MERATERKALSDFEIRVEQANQHILQEELEKAEESFASALHLVYRDPGQKDKIKQCLLGLSNVLRKQALKDTNIEKLVQSVGLLNGVLNRAHDEKEIKEINCKLREMDRDALSIIQQTTKLVSPQDTDDLEDIDAHNMFTLESLRHSYSQAMREIDEMESKVFQPVDSQEPHDSFIEQEKLFIGAVSQLYTSIASDMRQFLHTVAKQSEEKLGPPPCKYAILGLGSLAREEMTPYSDYEFAILVEKNTESIHQYFCSLTHYMHIRVLNLRETIVPSLGIRSLNNTYSENLADDWFWDDGPRGVSFDAAFPWASKIPTGRKSTSVKEWETDYISTPSKLASFQRYDIDEKEGYHTAEILRTFVLVTGNEALVNSYEEEIGKITKKYLAFSEHTVDNGDDINPRKTKALKQLIEDADKYASYLHLGVTSPGTLWQVKKDMYRFPSVFIESIGNLYEINTKTSWEACRKIPELGIMNDQAAHNLRMVHSIGAWLRIKTYMSNKSQKESFTPIAKLEVDPDGQTNVQEVYHIEKVEILYRFVQTIIPLYSTARYIGKEVSYPLVPSGEKLIELGSWPKIYAYFRSMRYTELFAYLNEKEEVKESNYPNICTQGKLCQLHAFEIIGQISIDLKKYTTALHYLKDAVTIHHKREYSEDLPFTLYLLGEVYDRLGEPLLSQQCYMEGISLVKANKPKKYSENMSLQILVRGIYYMGKSLKRKGQLKASVMAYTEALEKAKQVSEEVSSMSLVGNCLHDLALAYCDLGNLDEAKKCASEALTLKTRIYGVNTAHPHIAETLCLLGIVHLRRGEINSAALLLEECKGMYKLFYGNHATGMNVIQAEHNLALCHLHLGETHKAKAELTEVLHARKKLQGEDTNHIMIAATLTNLGICCMKEGDKAGAVFYHLQAYEMQVALYGDSNHPHIADTLFNLATDYWELQNYSESVHYYKKSLDKAIAVYGPTSSHTIIERSLIKLGTYYKMSGDVENLGRCMAHLKLYNSRKESQTFGVEINCSSGASKAEPKAAQNKTAADEEDKPSSE